MSLPINQILQGHVLDVLRSFPNDCIDVVVTSPPYWALRNYGEDTISEFNDWKGQLGLEPNPQMFINHLVEIFREVKRVLKPTGSFWLNMGDTYCSSGKNNVVGEGSKEGQGRYSHNIHCGRGRINIRTNWLQPKQLLMIPERIAIAMQEDDGWILRNKICWRKPNHMPSSVRDRLSSSYEFVYLFVKNRKYYFDLDSIRIPHAESGIERAKYSVSDWKGTSGKTSWCQTKDNIKRKLLILNPLGKNPSDMWNINTESQSLYWCPNCKKFVEIFVENKQTFCKICKQKTTAHFACFPQKLVKRILKASCPRWICSKCGKPRFRIVEGRKEDSFNIRIRDTQKGRIKSFDRVASEEEIENYDEKTYHKTGDHIGVSDTSIFKTNKVTEHHTVGWTDCGCGVEFVSGIVLDPFMGSGTTAVVARKLNLNFIGIDIKQDYVDMANYRLSKFAEKLDEWFK